MRIKHFAGYGCVNARKLAQEKYHLGLDDECTRTLVEVCGNHEQGLTRPFKDESCIERWLGRFMPKGHRLDHYQNGYTHYIMKDGVDTEYVVYALYSK